MNIKKTLAVAAAASMIGVGGSTAAFATETFTPKEYTLVFRMPDTATHRYNSWFDQKLINRNGVIPAEGCAKFQIDWIKITTPEQETVLEGMLADGILTKAEDKKFPEAGYVRGTQVWKKDTCGVTPPPVVPPTPKPVITKDLVQEDTYRYTSASELRTIKAFAADKKLVYREDKAQWNDSTWRIIERTFTNGKLTSTKVVKAGGNGARAKGSKIVMTWKLGKGATVNAPWGVKKNIPQTFVR